MLAVELCEPGHSEVWNSGPVIGQLRFSWAQDFHSLNCFLNCALALSWAKKVRGRALQGRSVEKAAATSSYIWDSAKWSRKRPSRPLAEASTSQAGGRSGESLYPLSAREFLPARSLLYPTHSASNHSLCCPLVMDSGKHNIAKTGNRLLDIKAHVRSIRVSTADLRTLQTRVVENEGGVMGIGL